MTVKELLSLLKDAKRVEVIYEGEAYEVDYDSPLRFAFENYIVHSIGSYEPMCFQIRLSYKTEYLMKDGTDVVMNFSRD